MDILDDPQLKLAHDLIKDTNKSVFLTGKAGTGKTTFLRNIPIITKKRMVVVAPTGVAAINAGGATIHSFFQLPFSPFIPEGADLSVVSKNEDGEYVREESKLSSLKIKIVKSLDLLVIDEISMVRSDLLDAIDDVLRKYRRSQLPFGGIQLLMIGDLYQLTPVIKDDELQLTRRFYRSPYFFDSIALRKVDYVTVELNHIFRQNDEVFISILNEIRNNTMSSKSIEILNQRVNPSQVDEDGCITLTTHNAIASDINNAKLQKIDEPEYTFTAEIRNNFPAYMYPTEEVLTLKKGSQVMFIKNDSSMAKAYYNGKIGKVTEISENSISVKCDGDYYSIDVSTESWENNKYILNPETKEIEQEVVGEFLQYPLRLAWAITIHKSQGLTFERAIVDVNAAFAFGQVYVALSRCRSLDGLTLKTPISSYMIKSDSDVVSFTENSRKNSPDEHRLLTFMVSYQQGLIFDLFTFDELRKILQDIKKIYFANLNKYNSEYSSFFNNLLQSFDNEIFDVNKKFVNQLKSIFYKSQDVLPEKNELLLDRMKKASSYYLEKLDTLIYQPFLKMNLETDNKEVNKTMFSSIEKMELSFMLKNNCLKDLLTTFSPEKYHKILADTENGFVSSLTRKRITTNSYTGENAQLYYELNSWRKSVAGDSDTPVYFVLSQVSLIEIVHKMPITVKDLSKIKGIGKQKLIVYGNDILNIIKKYCVKYGLKSLSGDDEKLDFENLDTKKEPSTKKVKQPKVNSREMCYNLFRSGKTIEEIAAVKKITEGTVYDYLTSFVAIGTVQPEELVGKEKFQELMNFIETAEDKSSLSKMKTESEEKFSYRELKVGLEFLKRE